MRRNRIHLGLCLWLGLSAALAARAELKVGDPLPPLTSFGLEGAVPELPKDTVLLVDFWASWCVPCAQSFPALEQFHKSYGSKGLLVLGVNMDEKKANMEHFLKAHSVSFALVRDAGQKLAAKAGLQSMPSSFLIDRHGKVAFIHTGFRHGDIKQFEREIQSLLAQDSK
jgi:thiol-disulfide isomerase/thioredoxin